MRVGALGGLFKKSLDADAHEQSEKRVRLAVILGAAAMMLILLSNSFSCDGAGSSDSTTAQELTAQQYAEQLENKLSDMISRVDGAGETIVMVTLDSGVEYIYASEEQISSDERMSSEPDGGTDSDTSSDRQSSYIIIDGENGEQALVRTRLMPRISGVVVLCEGADDEQTAEQIKQIVITALGISSRRVYVARLSG